MALGVDNGRHVVPPQACLRVFVDGGAHCQEALEISVVVPTKCHKWTRSTPDVYLNMLFALARFTGQKCFRGRSVHEHYKYLFLRLVRSQSGGHGKRIKCGDLHLFGPRCCSPANPSITDCVAFFMTSAPKTRVPSGWHSSVIASKMDEARHM